VYYFRLAVRPAVISAATAHVPATRAHVLSVAETVEAAVLHVVSGLFVGQWTIVKIEVCRPLKKSDRLLKSGPFAAMAAAAESRGFVFELDSPSLPVPHEDVPRNRLFGVESN
jgi:hypothetical protein